MKDYKKILEIILEQEKLLQFNNFSNEDAWQLGQLLVEKAKAENKSVTVDITRNGQQLFHYAMPGTTADNDEWVQRKIRVVNRFFHSSHYMSMALESKDTTIEEAYLLEEAIFAAHGGSFPINIKDTGVIGTITVSGLASAEDHQMVVDVLMSYLGFNI